MTLLDEWRWGVIKVLVVMCAPGACDAPGLPVCNHVTSDGVAVTIVASGAVVLDATFTMEGEAVPWWDQCGATLVLKGSADGHPIEAIVEFPECVP